MHTEKCTRTCTVQLEEWPQNEHISKPWPKSQPRTLGVSQKSPYAFSNPHLLAPVHLVPLSHKWALPTPEFYNKDNRSYVFFCIWIDLLDLMLGICIHVVVSNHGSLIFILVYYSTEWLYYNTFTYFMLLYWYKYPLIGNILVHTHTHVQFLRNICWHGNNASEGMGVSKLNR